MTTQTVKKLTRLLEIEKAKVAAIQSELDKRQKICNDLLYEMVEFKMRNEQAMAILQGEQHD
jgi:hypothetical protein